MKKISMQPMDKMLVLFCFSQEKICTRKKTGGQGRLFLNNVWPLFCAVGINELEKLII
jgi:hypothetical protein